MWINIPENTLFTYPDISIFCGEVKTLKEDQNTATYPIGIIEILSPSTRKYDRGEKFMLYRAIPSLKDYILVVAEAIHTEHFSINKENLWQLKESNKINGEIFLEGLNVKLPLEEIYEDCKL